MRVRVRLFGALAERAGSAEALVEVPEDATAADLVEAMGKRLVAAAPILGQVSVAVNLEVVPGRHPLQQDDEVALLPPVAGGATITVGVREGPPSVEEALEAVATPGAGGTVVFVGTVRDRSDEVGAVDRLEYSAYREMAEKVLGDVAEETARRWPVAGIAILHGVGTLSAGDRTVVVACSSAHREEAFQACRHAIDDVKRRVPIWKKEVGPAGERWVGLDEGHPVPPA